MGKHTGRGNSGGWVWVGGWVNTLEEATLEGGSGVGGWVNTLEEATLEGGSGWVGG